MQYKQINRFKPYKSSVMVDWDTWDSSTTIAVTGHRPNKLWGYKDSEPVLKALATIKSILINYHTQGYKYIISGMALGMDMYVARMVLELQEEGYDLKLIAAIPFENQDSKWNEKDREFYKLICSKADIVVEVSDPIYDVTKLQRRNRWMVDHADRVFALWDNTRGGTANCVKYAISHGVIVDYIAPDAISLRNRRNTADGVFISNNYRSKLNYLQS